MIEIVIPEPERDRSLTPRRLAPRSWPVDGARLTLIDNCKPKANLLLRLVGENLAQQLSLASVTVFDKGSASRVIDESEVAAIAKAADMVITGLGDCGACSACSLGDAISLEAAGVPSTVLITDVFLGHVAALAADMGLAGYHAAAVPHPVSSKGDASLAGFAAAVTEQIARQLTGDRSART